MKKQLKHKIKCVFILIIVFIFLFQNKTVLADNPDVSSLEFKFTYYSDQATGYNSLGSGLTYKDFTVNPKYNWYEYEKEGKKYVVLAAATEELLAEGWGPKKPHIHYFHYNDTIQFKFKDQGFDSDVYNGIILDSCGASMGVGEGEPQILDVYITGAASESINQKIVLATDDGSWKSSAGEEKSDSGSGMASEGGIGEFVVRVFATLFFILPADGIQWFLGGCEDLTYTKSEIEEDEKLNNEIQVDNADSDIDTKALKTVNIPSEIDDKKGEKQTVYTEDTEIPVIPVETYSMSLDKLDMLDVNFFNTSNSNKSKFWKLIKKFSTLCSHFLMYFSAVAIMLMLIVRSIMLVISTVGDSPEKARESREIMDNVFGAVIMLVGVFVIMTLITYSYKMILDVITNNNDSRYLMRINVEDVYSFNTNLTGFLKYMTLSENVLTALGYSILYLLVAITNLIWFGFMLLRMLFIGMLIIIAPITAVVQMLGEQGQGNSFIGNLLHFRNLIRFYVIFVYIPLIIILIQRIGILL